MSTVERRQEEKEQRRNDIVDAAEVVFARKGVEKATMADVAKEARLSRGLIYFYFKDKDDLYLAIMLRATRALRESFEEAVNAHKSGYDKILAIGLRARAGRPDRVHGPARHGGALPLVRVGRAQHPVDV